jgi:hypothetical protein
MKIPTLSPDLVEGLRSRFFAKDRSIYLAANCLAYLNNGAYLSNAFIAETALGASAASVTFSNIPQGFRSLLLITQARTDAAAENDNINIRLNNDSGANYDFQQVYGNSTTVAATTNRATSTPQSGITEAANSRSNTFAPAMTLIPGYASTSEKWLLTLTAAFGNVSADTDLFAIVRAVRWRNGNAITSMVIVPQGGPNFVAGSRFQLYGML